MKLFLGIQLVYLVTIWFEYFSLASAYRANQRLAKAEDRLPLSKEALNKSRIGYLFEWIFGALGLACAYPLLGISTFGVALFVLSLFPLFIIRNVMYSLIANIYYNKKFKEYKESLNVERAYHYPEAPKNSVKG